MFVQPCERCDGAAVLHLILCRHAEIDRPRLLMRIASYGESLFARLVNFRFVCSDERGGLPAWPRELIRLQGEEAERASPSAD